MKTFSFITGVLLIACIISACEKKVVVQKDSIITWNNPADIAYGTALSAAQLNATADSPGEFVYNPPAGTVLLSGSNQNLKVSFTPSDLESYKPATQTVQINVTPVFGSVTDTDGNSYKTIVFGTQTWMAENLKTSKFRNGELIPNVTENAAWGNLTTAGFCWHNNNISNKANGGIYNWYAVDDSRKISPAGWHIPTDAEWTTLINFLGGATIAGDKIKSCGFSDIFGSDRAPDGTFGFVGVANYWWGATQTSNTEAWTYHILASSEKELYRSPLWKKLGMCVRCVKD